MTVPYENANSATARHEIQQILRRFGCESIGFMDDYEEHSVLLAFRHRGHHVQLKASAKGWAAMWLKEHPYRDSRQGKKHQHEAKALEQGQRATNSILRDWIKGQVTAVEVGILTFEGAFLGQIMLPGTGKTVLEQITTGERPLLRLEAIAA